MKNITSLLFILLTSIGFTQVDFDFESPIPTMVGYDNATFTIESNPDMTGNSSTNVGRVVKVAADQFAGGKITGLSAMDFSNLSTSVLSMKVYTSQPIGTIIRIKLEGPFTGEKEAVTTVSGAWETLTFDFGPLASTGSTDLVIMPQPYTAGNGNTFYFDDIQQIAGPTVTPLTGLPIDFETGINDDNFENFQSAFATVVANPHIDADNGSATVGKIVRYLGEPYGGSKLTFSNNIDFSSNTVITMKIWTSAPIGTDVTLKTEKPGWGAERSVETKKTSEWETLSFDFSGELSDMPSLVFIFDFKAGSTNRGDGSANSTFFFDDVKFDCTSTNDPIPDVASLSDISGDCEVSTLTAPTATDECGNSVTGVSNVTLPISTIGETLVTWTYTDVDGNSTTQDQKIIITCSSVALSENTLNFVSIYPNPNNGNFRIKLNSSSIIQLQLIDITGKVIEDLTGESLQKEVAITGVESGVYFLKADSQIYRVVVNK